MILNRLYKKTTRWLIKKHLIIIDSLDEEEAEKFFSWLYSD